MFDFEQVIDKLENVLVFFFFLVSLMMLTMMMPPSNYMFKVRNKNQQKVIIGFLVFIVSWKDAGIFIIFEYNNLLFLYLTWSINVQLGLLPPTQLFTCSKSTIEIPEEYVKTIQG